MAVACADEIGLAESTNYPTTQRIQGIASPADKDELVEIVRAAHASGTSLYTVSTGKNWGYGSRVPVATGAVLVQLHRLDQITDFDEELGYIRIQPGVTFQQVHEFLRARKSRLRLSITSGDPRSSLMGNILERGVGTGAYADRMRTCCNMEVLLPDGRLIHTDYAKLGPSRLSHCAQHGVGPSIMGLFTQSNLGIATELTVWLAPIPQALGLVFYGLQDRQALCSTLPAIRQLITAELVRPTLAIFNDVRVLSALAPCPWDRVYSQRQLDAAVAECKRDQPLLQGICNWNGDMAIGGIDAAHVRDQLRHLQGFWRPSTGQWRSRVFSHDEMVALRNDSSDASAGGGIEGMLLQKHLGMPNARQLQQLYWAKGPMPDATDPDRDRCGLLWICPEIPFRPADLGACLDILYGGMLARGFDPAVSLQIMQERSIRIIASMAWDRDRPRQEREAMDGYRAISRDLRERGYHFYRNNTLAMPDADQGLNSTDEFLGQMKQWLDPQGIFSPGRYIAAGAAGR